MTFEQFIRSVPHAFKPEERALLERVFEFGTDAHHGQKRKSGEDYFNHPTEAAILLGQIFPDFTSLAAVLLHDVPEDTQKTLEDIRAAFGNEVAHLVDGVTKLGGVRLRNSTEPLYVESLRKMFIATGKDIRVMLVKLADRLHNMRTIQFLSPEKQLKIATETLEVYAPLAARLGINQWKDELEDRSFAICSPELYQDAKEILAAALNDKEHRLLEKQLTSILKTEGVKFVDVYGRTKRVYSFHKKIQKYEGDQGKIMDLIAFRIITKSTADCYAALGVIHKHFQPLPGRIKDYIGMPKPNGYQSLH
ncbi:MAG: bifunctional (p)ppGpp synthetase/guanosine-3',5'-bis(diphosphate) 3'-pyrophosphohydrolase, partial [Candidatus Doudnabacteria bacterium]|nr:bifunctional (p)ppGpp synthetase/guanosine-3',5'-bis(diphosphate) 3'-pyrophosphohydrolase [Candidatus Doudnabacteria bacterium]